MYIDLDKWIRRVSVMLGVCFTALGLAVFLGLIGMSPAAFPAFIAWVLASLGHFHLLEKFEKATYKNPVDGFVWVLWVFGPAAIGVLIYLTA